MHSKEENKLSQVSQDLIKNETEEKKLNQASQDLIKNEKEFGTRVKILVDYFETEKDLIDQDSILTKVNALMKEFAALSPHLVENFSQILIDSTPDKKSSDLINDFFIIYSKYIPVYNEYLQAAERNSERFKTVSDKLPPQQNNLLFNAFVIEPIQRGCRYSMSLKAILDLDTKLSSDNAAKLTDPQIELIDSLIKLSDKLLMEVNSAQPKGKKGIGYFGTSFGTGAYRASVKNWWKGTTTEQEPAKGSNETLSEDSFTLLEIDQEAKHSWRFGVVNRNNRRVPSSKSDLDKKDELQDLPMKKPSPF